VTRALYTAPGPSRLPALDASAVVGAMGGAVGGVEAREATRPAGASPGEVAVRAVEVTVEGVVQGVGFRPFVHRLALRHHIAGWVRNEAGAVRVVAQGTPAEVGAFLAELRGDIPPLARIRSFEVRDVPPRALEGFRVLRSRTSPVGRLPVSPDVAVCPACAAEMGDPTNRRYRYPFITCTDCGPRFTVIESMPYDRERSTMRAFAQCPACLAEYADPGDRRYHSETNSCPECGPSVWMETRGGKEVARGDAAIVEAGGLLGEGAVLAVRGLGGFHLAADAGNERAVELLRRRKGRDAKPLAVMVADLDGARRIAWTSPDEEALLTGRERPIVVLRRRRASGLASGVAPGLDSVGVMLAYTPLHHLLLEAVAGRPLVMTSGNVSEEPIAISNEEARERLASIADHFLLHDREIVARYDDSLVRVADGAPVFLRRSRGYAPLPVPLPVPVEGTVLAVGPHLKNTFTLAHGRDAYVSQHVGDLENLETLEHYQDAMERFHRLFRLDPGWVVRDLHPGYLSTRLADESGISELPPVQHHHAHVAAVAGEHGVTEPVLGLAFDGTGYGDDGRVWGCEFLVADLTAYVRVAHLRYAPLPGGERAVRAPWRSLLGYLSLDGEDGERAFLDVPPSELAVARRQICRGVNAPEASSMGRLFDAAAAALGVRAESAYEAQAAMELEGLAARVGGDPAEADPLPFPVTREYDPVLALDPVPLLTALLRERWGGTPVESLAARFHGSVVRGVSGLALELCSRHGLGTVALGGGCFQNALLLSSLRRRLEVGGVRVLVPRALGPNDGAVSYGQAVIAAARMNH